ncbi:sugar phosphate isomerase/epimerase [Lachnospiraceae bacterium PF1-21]|uniref:Sugar phosphate isomerase/epimerase n=1 Tax=Ohessyouella blattaphilus TaxID=2949333 RepID=A0ABT1EJ06_9FIRM|nr:sugar phosphate isomerase/epimerase family protein [Ohessyouella blattaphilus]MCP1110684.1 sugar phosphate isomerase/epimerase [Ohessyouella blattaphilus]MCR8564078.1 sugar phosphate isomerase/epimerase [Ohessyouella blattaphilus]
MKLGFISSILDTCSFKEVIDTASSIGYECVEVACWPKEKATRRYAGVTHIDISELTPEYISDIKAYCQKKEVEISALAYYPNTITDDMTERAKAVKHLEAMIMAAPKLGVDTITTFIGRVQNLTIERNLEIFKEIWTPLIKLAENQNVRIAIENCPMLFGPDQWPGGQNLMSTPAIWRKAFELVPSPNFGLNYDPSHFVWQNIDYIKPLYEFKDKIFHVHYKDIKVYQDRLNDVGSLAYPLEFMSPKLPGLGDVDWGKYVSALTDIGYDSYTCIEIEDKAFETTHQKVLDSLNLSYNYMRQFVI